MKIKIILAILAVFALSPMAQAVSPAPDGGYAGGNTAEGQNALFSLTTGTYNTAVGFLSLRSNADGNFNTAIGAGALLANTSDQNTATGAGALVSSTIASQSTANGAFALFNDTTGTSNTAIGNVTLYTNTTGNFNTAVGNGALSYSTGSSNTALGSGAGDNIFTANNVICIGQGAQGQDVSDSCYIGNIWNQPGGSQAVYVNSDGKLGALVSSRRFKDEIKPIEQASEIIYGLRPVSFRYKPEIEPTRPRAFGLIAEDVEKVSADLVTRGSDGKVNSVRYDQVNAMLLNEFLKEHKKVQQLEAASTQRRNDFEATIAELRKEIAGIVARSRDQDEKIQKVSAQVELNKTVSRKVANK
jgi:Chaperone of endosialidase